MKIINKEYKKHECKYKIIKGPHGEILNICTICGHNKELGWFVPLKSLEIYK